MKSNYNRMLWVLIYSAMSSSPFIEWFYLQFIHLLIYLWCALKLQQIQLNPRSNKNQMATTLKLDKVPNGIKMIFLVLCVGGFWVWRARYFNRLYTTLKRCTYAHIHRMFDMKYFFFIFWNIEEKKNVN